MSDNANAVMIGGRQFVASPLTLGTFRRQSAALKRVMEMKKDEHSLPSEEEFSAIITIVGASVKPSDGGTMDNFAAFVDGIEFKAGVRDIFNALTAVMKASGYVDKTEAETAASGESPSAAPLT